MVNRIKTRPHIETRIEFSLVYDYLGKHNWGYAFDCDESGKPILTELEPCGLESLRYCQSNPIDESGKPVFQPPRVDRIGRRIRQPGLLICDCGSEHSFGWGDSQCQECDQWFNACGQRLNPPNSRGDWEEDGYALDDARAESRDY